MLMELLLKRKSRNLPYVSKGVLPLGLSLNANLIFKKLPRISDSMIIVAMPGRGKSVIMRLMYYFISLVRPIVVFDWEGEDHKLSRFPNSSPINLPPGIKPCELMNSVFFVYGKDREFYEREIKPNLENYDVDELEAIGFSTAGGIELKRILRKYRGFKDLYDLIDFIRVFPTNSSEAGKIKADKKNLPHPAFKHYLTGDSIHFATKQNILKTLEYIANKELFNLNDKKDYDIVNFLREGKNLFFNFGGDVGLARVEIMKKMAQIIKYRKEEPNKKPPAIFFEEADALFPRNPNDKEAPLVYKGIYGLLRGRKLSLAQYYCAPSFDNLHPRISTGCNEKIFGQMQGRDLNALTELTRDDYLLNTVRGLIFNRYTNEREFVYVDEFNRVFVFKPFECPQEIHREA